MLAWMLEAGADATQPTRTPSQRGAFTYCLRQTKCESARTAARFTYEIREPPGSSTTKRRPRRLRPLHVCGGSWKIWSVTLPRLLAGAGELNTQALDLDEACIPLVRALATSDGQPALATADVLAQCGFYGRAVALLYKMVLPSMRGMPKIEPSSTFCTRI